MVFKFINMDAHADENRIFCIDESEKSLTLLDERIEKAIDQTGARLIILDPVQGLWESVST